MRLCFVDLLDSQSLASLSVFHQTENRCQDPAPERLDDDVLIGSISGIHISREDNMYELMRLRYVDKSKG